MNWNRQTNRHQPDDATELSAIAQHYFATRFINPQRHGCPAPGMLQTLVRSAQLPDDELHAHLFRCSECFSEYRAAVLAHREAQTPASWWHALLAGSWGWRNPLLAGAGARLSLNSLQSLFSFQWIAWRRVRPYALVATLSVAILVVSVIANQAGRQAVEAGNWANENEQRAIAAEKEIGKLKNIIEQLNQRVATLEKRASSSFFSLHAPTQLSQGKNTKSQSSDSGISTVLTPTPEVAEPVYVFPVEIKTSRPVAYQFVLYRKSKQAFLKLRLGKTEKFTGPASFVSDSGDEISIVRTSTDEDGLILLRLDANRLGTGGYTFRTKLSTKTILSSLINREQSKDFWCRIYITKE